MVTIACPVCGGDNDCGHDPFSSLAAKYEPVNWAEAFKRQPEEVDWIFPPILEAGTVNALFGPPGIGKAIAVDTPLPTPDGWTLMGKIQVGDLVIGADGKPTRVVAATEVLTGRPCYEVEFDDKTVITADADHLWLTETRSARAYRTASSLCTTKEIAQTILTAREGRRNHSVRVAGALELPEKYLPLHPYALGVWLGDGDSAGARVTTADPEVLENLAAAGIATEKLAGKYHYRMELVRQAPEGPVCAACSAKLESRTTGTGILRDLGVLGDKHIPRSYLRASETQRRALLAGLLDTDGYATNGSAEIGVTSRRLAEGIRELILSLGYRCSWREKRVKGRTEASSVCYTMTFSPREKVFWLSRKDAKHREKRTDAKAPRRRFITSVRPVDSVPVRCIQVAARDGLYLAGRSMIPTHNSLITLEIALTLVREGRTVMYVDDENRIEDTVDRLQAFGATHDELAGLIMYSFAGLPPLDKPEGGEHLCALADHNRPALVVLDTTTRMVEGDENAANTFLQLYRCSLVPLKQRRITVLRLDHPGKEVNRGQRGSSAKDGDVDTVWKINYDQGGMLVLERTKSRSGHGEGWIAIRREREPVLRHDWQALDKMPVTPLVMQWAQNFDRWGIPSDAGRPTLREVVKNRPGYSGDGVSTTVLALVARYRKSRADTVPGSPGQLG